MAVRWLVLALCACRPPAASPPAPSNAASTADGLLVPTDLDPDVAAVTTATGADARHYFCTPTSAAAWNGHLVIYLVGPREDPATAHAFAERACGLGYATLAPAYRNERAIRDLCEADAACYEAVRREIIYGEDRSPTLTVDRANGLLHRIDTVAAHLATTVPAVWVPLAKALADRDYSHVIIAGFSQGSGHALVLAHDFAVERLVMLSGVPDRAGDAPAAWIARWAASAPNTSGERMFGINHADDPFLSASALAETYDALGVPAAACDVREERPTGECHRFVVHTDACAHRVDADLLPALASFGTRASPCAPNGPLRHLGPTWDYVLAAH